jgi:hypothetical protein
LKTDANHTNSVVFVLQQVCYRKFVFVTDSKFAADAPASSATNADLLGKGKGTELH